MADIMKMGKNPNYMGSWDLEEVPKKEVTLTIAKIVEENVVTNGKTEACAVCYWKEKTYKPMILNPTNKKMICKVHHTKDTDKLVGKQVVIGIEKVKAFGDVFDALRIKNKLPAPPKEKSYTCADCGKAVVGIEGFSAEKIAAITHQRYGVVLCSECSAIRKNKSESEANEDA